MEHGESKNEPILYFAVARIVSPNHNFPSSAKTAEMPTSLCIPFSVFHSVKAWGGGGGEEGGANFNNSVVFFTYWCSLHPPYTDKENKIFPLCK